MKLDVCGSLVFSQSSHDRILLNPPIQFRCQPAYILYENSSIFCCYPSFQILSTSEFKARMMSLHYDNWSQKGLHGQFCRETVTHVDNKWQ